MHLALRLSRSENWLSRHVWVAYLAVLPALPVILSESFVSPRAEPLAAMSSWACQAPWAPHIGPLALLFLAAWVGAQAWVQLVLWRFSTRPEWSFGRLAMAVALMRLAFLAQAACIIIDACNTAFGLMIQPTSPFVIPLAIWLMGMGLWETRKSSTLGAA